MKALLISLVFLTGIFSFSPRPESILQDVLSYTNSFRKSKGRAALIMRDDLNAIAQKHSENMARGKVEFGHNGFGEREALAKQKIEGANAFAENVAYGATSGKEVVDEWRKSPGHRRNMLGDYKYIGIGIATDKRGNIYYTQLFVN
jgi:uncharacterized protein YkwD